MSEFREEEYTILVVDDEEDLAEIVGEELSDLGFNVRIAFGGHEAMEIVEREKIDYVISDIKMPGGDGKELLSRIRAKDSKLPIVLLMTGFSEYSEFELKDSGAIELLNKPIHIDVLYERLKQHFAALKLAS